MSRKNFGRLTTMGLALSFALLSGAGTAQAAITLNFVSNDGSLVTFIGNGSGATFALQPSTAGPQFNVQNVQGSQATGDGTDIEGSVTGDFSYSSAGLDPNDIFQTTDLTGTGTLVLEDPDGATLTATITGSDIFTVGGVGGTNTESIINIEVVSFVTDGGPGVSDLTQFYLNAQANGGIASLSFQFINPSLSLSDLAQEGTRSTTYSGSLSANPVPEPATVMSLVIGLPLVGIGAWARKRRAQS